MKRGRPPPRWRRHSSRRFCPRRAHALEQLIQEVVVVVPRALIAEAVDVVVFICGRGEHAASMKLSALSGSMRMATP